MVALGEGHRPTAEYIHALRTTLPSRFPGVLFSFVPADVGHLIAMVNELPENCNWGSFAISRMQMPWVAQSILLGGNVRVGLEDNLYLSKGVYASNAQLVEKARTIIEAMGARVLTPGQTRERLKLG